MNYKKSQAKDASRAQFRGIWAAITTPFTPDLALDEAGLRRNMRYLTGTLHVDGVFCTGVMGEFWSLTKEERKRIVEIVVEEARGKCGVIAQTGSTSAHETVELTRHAEEAGADFVIMMTPFYPHTDEAMVYDWFAFVAARVNIGIWLFDTPYSGRPAISPATTARLAQHREHLRRQDRAPARALSRGAAALRRQDRHELAVGNRFPDDDARPRPAGASILGLAVPDPDRRLAADARLHRAGAGGPLRRGRQGFGDAERCARGRQALAARALARHPRAADRRDQGVVGDARHGGRAGAHAAAADEREERRAMRDEIEATGLLAGQREAAVA